MEDIIKTKLSLKTCKSTNIKFDGCVSAGRAYETENGYIFVKTNTKEGADIMFNGEFESLKEISETGMIRVPTPLLVDKSFLVIEYLKMQSLDKFSAQLGEALARLHLHNSLVSDSVVGAKPKYVDQFGFHSTTCCGFLPLNNDWCSDWVRFFTQQRLETQISMIIEKGERDIIPLWSQLQLKIPNFFKDIEIKPSLLHGDLWSGNAGETIEEGVIFDCGAFYGHHEFDLGIDGMFGGFSNSFYSSYHKIIPRATGFENRHQLYQLFHYLNHWNHFGTQYKSSSLKIMQQLVSSF